MASLVTNATRIATAKENIRQSIINKGVEVSADLKIEDYSSKIDLITTGIEEGTYSIEVYVRIDGELVGEGVEFNAVGTDGTTTAVTSRAGGYVFLTLSYGVGYDIQPKDEEAYYAESHPLIYHLKDEGDYFAADYYFSSTALQGDFKIKDCAYMFCENSRLDLYDFLFPTLSKTPTNINRMFKGKDQNNPMDFKYIDRYFEIADFSQCTEVKEWCFYSIINDTEDKIINLDFPLVIDCSYFFADIIIKNPITITANINVPKTQSLNSACQYVGMNSNLVNFTFIFDFQGTTGKVTNFGYTFSGCSNGNIKIRNFNMDKVTSSSSIFQNASAVQQFTFSGSFGGLSTTSSLTLDMSKCTKFTIEALTEMLESISENTNGNTRIIKLPSALYSSLTEDLLLLAMEKGYELSA